jgi:hypothetical protein
MSMRVWAWSGPNGGTIEVDFDDKYSGLEEMHTEIAAMGEAHPNLPDEVPQGTVFTFSTEKSTGHLLARFRVGDSVLWECGPTQRAPTLGYRAPHRSTIASGALQQARFLKRSQTSLLLGGASLFTLLPRIEILRTSR